MKNNLIKPLLVAALFVTATQLPACKSKPKETTVVTDSVSKDTAATTAAAPVTVSPDAELTKNAADATKDFPGVTTNVADGEVTVTGNVKRDRLPKLMMSLNALHPKKVNNKLTITN